MAETTSEVSLGELLRLAFPRASSLSSPAARDVIVRWVVMAGNGVIPQAGDVILCGVNPTKKELTAWAEHGVAGVVIKAETAPANTQLPIVLLPTGASLREIQRAALELIVNRQVYLIGRGAEIYQALAHLSLEGAGLRDLAQAMLEQTGKTVLVQDKRLKPLAEAIASGLTKSWAEVQGALSLLSHLPESLRDRRQAASLGGWREQNLPGGLMRYVCPIVSKGMARGYLSIIGKTGEFDVLDQLVVEHGAAACALEMAKAKAVSEAEKRAHGDFVDAVLTGSLPLEELLRWAHRIGYDVEPPHAALVWRWGSGAGDLPSLRRLETIVNQSTAKLGVNALVRPRGNEVVIFCAVSDAGRPEAALKLANEVARAAADEYPQRAAHGGVGRTAAELADWRDSHREASQSLSMAARLNDRSPLFFGDLSVYRLLFQLEGNPELEAFCREVLGPLMDYEGSGDLLETLEAFCDRLGNLSQTAEKLFIHRNSLLYRMERISQLAGIDMNNPDTRLAVHLALKIRRMLRPAPARRER
jgi:purine catabolism regulator